MSESVLVLDNLTRTFVQGPERLEVLRGCSFAVARGERVALMGPSGSGKSTLLQCAGLLERADGGSLRIAGQDVTELTEAERTALRLQALGFVYQAHHLLPEFSALENIILPQMIAGTSRKKATARARDLLERVGLQARADHRPARLSGGEQQRVALARALANRPHIVIADEPTGNLDPHTAEGVFALLKDLAVTENLALLMATHNETLARRMDRVLVLDEGRVREGSRGG